MRFDLTDLQLFLNVHEAGTITAGAQRSYMTLASASERIRGMEALLGVALLERNRRGVALTEAGGTLLRHARLVLREVDQLHGAMDPYGKGFKGQVRLLCNTSALSEYLPEILGSYLERYPQVSIGIEERLSHEVVEAVREGFCDVGLVADSADLDGLQSFPFRHDPLTLVVPRRHPLASRRRLALAEVGDQDFIGLVEGSALQEHVNQHARRVGKHLGYRVRLRSFEAICRMVAQGIGIAIIPDTVAQRCARTLAIRRVALSDPWASRHLVVCVRHMEELSSHARQIVRYILGEEA